MRFQPLDTLKKNAHVGESWTEFELSRYMQYYSRLRWFDNIPFEKFEYTQRESKQMNLVE